MDRCYCYNYICNGFRYTWFGLTALKDIMILFIVMFLGIYLPYHYYGGFQPMFEAVEAAKPGFLSLPEEGMSISWFVSTIILTALGFICGLIHLLLLFLQK